MRVIDQPVRTYGSITLGAGPQVQNSTVLPNYGAVAGFWLDMTVALTGATASKTSNTIDNVINTFEIDDQFGKAIVVALGTDLSILNDILTPRGVRQAAPAVTTSGGGAGSAEWYLFLPITIGSGDMPGQLKLTFAAASALQNANLTSAGTALVTLVVRAAYPVGEDRPTLRITMANPPHQQGDNAFGPYLPGGFQMEALAFVLTGGDGDFGYLTALIGGASFATLAPLLDFTANDVMLMQSGHLSGEFICRFPVFVVDNTTIFTVNLSTDTAVRLYSIATVPQKRQ
jgi:hypothetical protein